jgi:hypothetical protein
MLEVFASATHAAGLPLVISATVDYTNATLTLSGQNFGSNPAVLLDSLTFPTQSSASGQIVGWADPLEFRDPPVPLGPKAPPALKVRRDLKVSASTPTWWPKSPIYRLSWMR